MIYLCDYQLSTYTYSPMQRTKHTLISFLICIICISVNAQDKQILRILTMKSDVILTSNSYEKTDTYVNDFSKESVCVINKVDSIIKNNTKFKESDYTARILTDGNDYFSDGYFGDGGRLLGSISQDVGKSYSNLMFLKKVGKQYQVLGIYENLEIGEMKTEYISKIAQVMEIEKIKDLNERYSKTLDWFIDNGFYPDNGFIEFYQQKGVVKESLLLNDEMAQKAKMSFLSGNEDLLPLIKDKFPDDVQKYYLLKMRNIRRSSPLSYISCYDFYEIISNLYNFGYNSMDYLLLSLLTDDNIDEYKKKDIMDYFINMTEEKKKLIPEYRAN
ncbi:hypothetical protein [Dysgonomonas sp. 520]|uniref:hypothetical protein n=1 Tax=Dysgonomonas sp. 520 TaxID=2302931 RepID=UPI0013D081BB|nr:hypothetical protein [Dysgonomonas sp. 520]NDW08088.1 hypothetical protein [Dysgonomonas sp. 520]